MLFALSTIKIGACTELARNYLLLRLEYTLDALVDGGGAKQGGR